MRIQINDKGQSVAPKTIKMNKDNFSSNNESAIYWMGNASMMINSRGTNIMIDPLLEGFDMPLLIDMPILPKDIPSLDGLLITHIDNDHFSRPTCKDVLNVCKAYHAPHYVAEVMREEGIPGIGHNINEAFSIKNINITLTKAKHNWQNDSKKYSYREWKEEDYCGYWLDTPDGTIWLPGDSRLLDEHLHMEAPDVILFDFADNPWHIKLEGAIKLANTYPNSDLICIHWGSVDAPEMSPFNGNPQSLVEKIITPERIKVLAPGEKYILTRCDS